MFESRLFLTSSSGLSFPGVFLDSLAPGPVSGSSSFLFGTSPRKQESSYILKHIRLYRLRL